jgi:ATP-dependent HslUV protease subunit HslV
MTCIAYRYGVIASDTLGTDSWTVIGHVHKTGRTEDGWLWGLTGHQAYMDAFIKWMEKREGDPPANDDKADMIVIDPSGRVRWWVGVGWVEPLPQDFYAWGSGKEVALGAMDWGADALGAVESAMKYETACGGHVEAHALLAAGRGLPLSSPPTINPVDPEFEDVPETELFDLVGPPIEPVAEDKVYRSGKSDWREKRGL